MFYWAVVHAVLMFSSESWVLSKVMEKMAEREHTGFLSQIMGKKERRNPDRTDLTLIILWYLLKVKMCEFD